MVAVKSSMLSPRCRTNSRGVHAQENTQNLKATEFRQPEHRRWNNTKLIQLTRRFLAKFHRLGPEIIKFAIFDNFIN